MFSRSFILDPSKKYVPSNAADTLPRPVGLNAANSHATNQHGKSRASYTKTGGVLSNEQKARLCILVRQAFVVACDREPVNTAELDAFRHAEVQRAVGKAGLTACIQGDYKMIEAHFFNLAGEGGRALNAAIQHGTEPERIALAKLKEACTAAGVQLGYAAAICRTKCKCALEDATAKQLWGLVFDLKKRKPKKVHKETRSTQIKTKEEDPF